MFVDFTPEQYFQFFKVTRQRLFKFFTWANPHAHTYCLRFLWWFSSVCVCVSVSRFSFALIFVLYQFASCSLSPASKVKTYFFFILIYICGLNRMSTVRQRTFRMRDIISFRILVVHEFQFRFFHFVIHFATFYYWLAAYIQLITFEQL